MRKRLTWDEDGLGKRASSELPDEGAASPAHQPEKGVDAYGMDSDFGSEPTSGPYGNGEHPSTPDEGAASPAFKAAALERKAAKCIRLASSMLGVEASVAEIEDQALAFMDLSDRSIQASLERLAEDEEVDEEEVEVEEGKKKASTLESRIARIERVLIRLAESEDPEGDSAKGSEDPKGEKDGAKGSEDPGEAKSKKAESHEKAEKDESEDFGGNKGDESKSDKDFEKKKADWHPGERAPGGWDPGSEEAMLEEMLVEEGMFGGDKGDDSMSHRDFEGMEHDEVGQVVMSDVMDPVGMDPMGLGAGMSHDEEMMMLAKLFDKSADIPAGEDKKEKEDHEKGAVADDKDHIKALKKDEKEDKADLKKDEESKKKAELKPQPKKASTGATRLGGVTKEASSEVYDLSKLWDSAPDVSKFF